MTGENFEVVRNAKARFDNDFCVYLCDRVRPNHFVNSNMTCHQIWHINRKNGDERPRPRVGRDIQMRGLGKKRRRRPKSNNDSDDEGALEMMVLQAPTCLGYGSTECR
ncbi:hypothetical protein PInf_019739 [Phytophthora infestans]|nr:hypothetical protein PInf_019739 [Phytophthora infestans]